MKILPGCVETLALVDAELSNSTPLFTPSIASWLACS